MPHLPRLAGGRRSRNRSFTFAAPEVLSGHDHVHSNVSIRPPGSQLKSAL